MTSSDNSTSRSAITVLLFLLGTAGFTAAYCLSPLYYSNQNQYFLHGLARAHQGQLDEDWLANTADPTPVFSTLVAVTARYSHPWAFYAYHALLLGVHAAALFSLFVFLAGREMAASRWPVFLLLLVAAHGGIVRWLSYRFVGFDYPWFLQAGLAGQYLLGAMLQPSAFGVLLVVAIALFVHGKPFVAAACAGLVGTFHSTYLLPAALVTLGFLMVLLSERRVKTAAAAGGLALVLVLPITVSILLRFGPTSAEQFNEAQSLLVNFRIPHHSRPDLWLDQVAVVQIAWVALGVALTHGTPLFPVLAVPSVLAALLTLEQIVTGSNTLALLFPWRISAVLVPVATAVILARIVSVPVLPLGNRAVQIVSVAGVLALAGAGVWISANREAFRSDDNELPLMAWVREHRSPGDVYLLPVRIPNLAATTRGSLSSDFKPLQEKKGDAKLIPVDLQRFRLHTETPTFVDFKSIPYRDDEVLAWKERLHLADAIQKQVEAGHLPDAVAEMRKLGITHLVRPAGRKLEAPGLERVYADDFFQVYKVVR